MHLADSGRSVLPPEVRLGTLCPVLEPKTPSSYISASQAAGGYVLVEGSRYDVTEKVN